MLECDAQASCLYVNEPKVKVDLTKYTERHTFRQAPECRVTARTPCLALLAFTLIATAAAARAGQQLKARTCSQMPCRFDDVFDEQVDNSQLYEQAVQPLVGTIFRYAC